MTVPVLTDKTTMQFILPSEYKEIGDAPVPTDPNVSIKSVPKRTVAVLRFCGWSTDDHCQRKFESLRQMLINDDMVDFESPPAADDTEGESDLSKHLLQTQQPYLVAHYHPPFTLPFFRRIEIWIPLSTKNERVAELLKTAEDPTYRKCIFLNAPYQLPNTPIGDNCCKFSTSKHCIKHPQRRGRTHGVQLLRGSTGCRVRLGKRRSEPGARSSHFNTGQEAHQEDCQLGGEVFGQPQQCTLKRSFMYCLTTNETFYRNEGCFVLRWLTFWMQSTEVWRGLFFRSLFFSSHKTSANRRNSHGKHLELVQRPS